EGTNTIFANVTDGAGNTAEKSVSVTLDTKAPTIAITTPKNGDILTNPVVTVSGTASDETGLDRVEVKVGDENWTTASGTTLWSASVTLKEGSNTIYAQAVDVAKNPKAESVTVTLNTKLITIKINDGAEYTNSYKVTLRLTSSADWMSFRNDNENWTDWEPFDSNKSWTLSGVDGKKTVYFRVSNNKQDQGLGSSDDIILDTTRPEVTGLETIPSMQEINKKVVITARVRDINRDASNIFALVESPDGKTSKCEMAGDGTYSCDSSNTSYYGRYGVTISAGDRAGNTNNTIKTWFVTTMKPYLDGSVSIVKDRSQSTGSIPLKKFVFLTTDSNINNYLNWMNIKIYYTEEELRASGLDENSLRISYYNKSSGTWGIPANSGVNTTNAGNFSGYAWTNVSHLSTFALVGNYPVPSQQSGGGSSSSSSSGGGGGGGGSSGEEFSNIEVIEKYYLYIYGNTVTRYKFNNNSNPVIFVNITGNINAGEIITMIEVLRNTSSLVKTQAPGTIYKNMNIWVGTSGFATQRNIQHAAVLFRVENAWLERNGFKGNEIKLVKWDGSTWSTQETSEKAKDGTYTYFEADTYSFSPFAITAMKETLPSVTVIIHPDQTPAGNGKQPEGSMFGLLVNWFLIIGILFVIGVIVEILLRMKKKQ
ncbi:MAG: PGF-pre-PGF domain-containing protein, partial [Candidatus Methanoperedens sp.]|nr:PGF-pre-PGF domain-containing protein [Candidatus Methanoperedens sp.]